MEFQVLKRSYLKRSIIIAVGVVLVLSAVILTFTRAKYRTTQSMPLLQGTINFSPYDFNVVAIYLNQEGAMPAGQTKEVPKFGYTLNQEQSSCIVNDSVDSRITMNYVTQTADEKAYITFDKMSQSGTKCTAYFDLIPDSENPVINNLSIGYGDTSITVNVNASDNIGIYYYYFKLDNGEEIRSEEATYTFDGLVLGSVHTVTVKVEDAAGHISESSSKEVTVGLKGGDIILASTYAPTATTTDWTNNGQGTTYYYTGNPNNWVQFGGYYWRIIRINGDGTIRLIYNGTTTDQTGESTQIGTSVFDDLRTDNMYVGYMYTSGQVHGTENSSTIKQVLDQWYQNNLSTNYGRYIDGNAGFCGDRDSYICSDYQCINATNGGGTGTTQTYYGAYIRLVTNNSPSLQCDSRDVYTTTDSNSGNQALIYPIGLVSADEVVLTGITYNTSNTASYLYTNSNYWTMSPYYFYNRTDNFLVTLDATIRSLNSYLVVSNTIGVRPVINLRADVELTGSGTTSDPFKVVDAS